LPGAPSDKKEAKTMGDIQMFINNQNQMQVTSPNTISIMDNQVMGISQP
jgi:hypothetical protein